MMTMEVVCCDIFECYTIRSMAHLNKADSEEEPCDSGPTTLRRPEINIQVLIYHYKKKARIVLKIICSSFTYKLRYIFY